MRTLMLPLILCLLISPALSDGFGGGGSVNVSQASAFERTVYAGASAYAGGMKCDNTTDDTAAFQAAVNASVSLQLQLPPGPCIISNTITFGAGPYHVKGYGTAFSTPATQLVWNGPTKVVTLVTNGVTASGNNTLHFASVPASIINGMTVSHLNNTGDSSITTQTVSSTTSTTVVLSANVAGGGIASGDFISFFNGAVNTAAVPMLQMQATQRSKFEEFMINANTGHPLDVGIQSENLTGGFQSTTNTYERIFMNGTTVGGLDKCWQFTPGGGVDANNDVNVFINTECKNFTTAALSLEHTQSKAHALYSFRYGGAGGALSAFAGITTALGSSASGGSFSAYFVEGGGVANDLYLGSPNDTINIFGLNNEGSGRLLNTTPATASSSWPVRIVGARWGNNGVNADGKVIIWNMSSGFSLENSLICSAGGTACQLNINSGTGTGRAYAEGNVIGTTLAQPFTTSNPKEYWELEQNTTNIHTSILDQKYPPITLSAISGGCNGTGASIPAGQAQNTQNSFRLTCSSTANTTFTATWPNPWIATPVCTITPETAGATPTITVNNTTTLTATYASTVSPVFAIHCDGTPQG